MRTIVMVSTKGGSGKSTLAQCIAVEASKGASVYLADLDPHESATNWWKRRKGPDNPMLVTGFETVSRAQAILKSRGEERDYLIVDTPGSFIGVVSDAIGVADAVCVVVQPSGKDLEAQGAAEDLIDQLKRRSRTLYIINRVDGRSSLGTEAAAKVAKLAPRQPFLIPNRTEFVRADAAGKTAAEHDTQLAATITHLWEVVKGIADVQTAPAKTSRSLV